MFAFSVLLYFDFNPHSTGHAIPTAPPLRRALSESVRKGGMEGCVVAYSRTYRDWLLRCHVLRSTEMKGMTARALVVKCQWKWPRWPVAGGATSLLKAKPERPAPVYMSLSDQLEFCTGLHTSTAHALPMFDEMHNLESHGCHHIICPPSTKVV
jgi:hypothetical protein